MHASAASNTDFLIYEWPLASAGQEFRKLVSSASLVKT